MKWILIVLGLLCASLLIMEEVDAGDLYLSGGVGIASSGASSLAETKLLNIGVRNYLGYGLSRQIECGAWTDRAGNGRLSSGYASVLVGVEADGPLTARVMFGPAFITTQDAYLGGHFQMQEQFYLGIRGKQDNTVGVAYKHFSSAGLYEPNVGRDFATAEISIPF